MTCPECFEKTIVSDTQDEGDSVYRKRKCKVCGYVFYTLEVDDPNAEHVLKKIRCEISQKRRCSK